MGSHHDRCILLVVLRVRENVISFFFPHFLTSQTTPLLLTLSSPLPFSVIQLSMGSLKRKSTEDPSVERLSPQKQQREDSASLNTLEESVACIHDVSYPEGYEPRSSCSSSPRKDSKPAKEFPFTLDPFQSEAIKCLDAEESVMVSSHILGLNSNNYDAIFDASVCGVK